MKKILFMLFVSLCLSTVYAQAPSPLETKKVLDYYYKGQQQPPILVELKLCESIYKEGDEKNNCEVEVNDNELTSGTETNVWMNFLVPKSTKANVLMQLNHKGITRVTRSSAISGSFRYRTWHKIKLNKIGDWTIKVFSENKDEVQELYSATINVKKAEEPVTLEAKPQ